MQTQKKTLREKRKTLLKLFLTTLYRLLYFRCSRNFRCRPCCCRNFRCLKN